MGTLFKLPTLAQRRRARLARFLLVLSQAVARGDLVEAPHGVMVVLAAPGDFYVCGSGLDTFPRRSMYEVRNWRAALHGERTAARERKLYEQSHPFICELALAGYANDEPIFCRSRFESEAGLKIHQRTSRRHVEKGPRKFGSRGGAR